MPDPSSERVTCPTCGKGYRWQAALVGRGVPCKQCGESFLVPEAPGVGLKPEPEPASGDSVYALDLGDETHPDTPAQQAAPARDGKCPSCNSPVKPHAVLCMNCGFNMREGKKVQTAVVAGSGSDDTSATSAANNPMHQQAADRASQRAAYAEDVAAATDRQHRWEETHRPLIILGIGLVFVLINAFALTPARNQMYSQSGLQSLSTGEAILAYFLAFAITIVLMVPLLLGGIFFMAGVLGSAFGNLFTALLKLFALVVLIVGLDQMIAMGLDLITGGFGGIGWMIRLSIVLGVFYPACAKLFDMESYEIAIMFLLYVIGPMAIGLLAAIIIGGYF